MSSMSAMTDRGKLPDASTERLIGFLRGLLVRYMLGSDFFVIRDTGIGPIAFMHEGEHFVLIIKKEDRVDEA